MKTIDEMNAVIVSQESKFNELATEVNAKVMFKRECEFALALLRDNDYLLKAAQANPESLKTTILCVASTGLSLNPIKKQAYLVPRAKRKGEPPAICLDISYMGMIDIASQEGSIAWAEAHIVFSNDTFKSNGPGKLPTHEFDPFSKDRGERVGAYCAAKVGDDYLVTTMTIDEIYSIRDKSPAARKKSGPWYDVDTVKNEMIKKTVIKRASKTWPAQDIKVQNAVQILNDNEGIEYKNGEQIIPISDDDQNNIIHQLDSLGKSADSKFYTYLSDTFKRAITGLEQLTDKEAKQVIVQLDSMSKKGDHNVQE